MPKNPNRISLSITPEYRDKLAAVAADLHARGLIHTDANGELNLSAVLRYLVQQEIKRRKL